MAPLWRFSINSCHSWFNQDHPQLLDHLRVITVMGHPVTGCSNRNHRPCHLAHCRCHGTGDTAWGQGGAKLAGLGGHRVEPDIGPPGPLLACCKCWRMACQAGCWSSDLARSN
jgi:hypothetical protein